MDRRALLSFLLLASLACGGSSCGYALAGRGSFLPAYIQTIGIPQFANTTPYYELEQVFTERVRTEFINRGKYKVLPVRVGVDALLSGEILGINITPASFTDQQQASRYIITVTAKIEFRDLKTDKEIWQNPQLVFSEQYDVTSTQTATDPNAFLGQNVNAMERLTTEFARTLVSAILESFYSEGLCPSDSPTRVLARRSRRRAPNAWLTRCRSFASLLRSELLWRCLVPLMSASKSPPAIRILST